jgi:hypothetical protein
MCSLSPLSLGLLEWVGDEIGGVVKRGGVSGLSGAGLGIRGETSGVREYLQLLEAKESSECSRSLWASRK